MIGRIKYRLIDCAVVIASGNSSFAYLHLTTPAPPLTIRSLGDLLVFSAIDATVYGSLPLTPSGVGVNV